MQTISEEGGILIYLRQEGHGIGLTQKYFAHKFQDMGYDTIEANEKLGYAADMRKFDIAAGMLKDLDMKKIRLLTNNLQKVKEMNENGIEVVERGPLFTEAGRHNENYLRVKKEKMGHQLQNI